jgi:hypothetical protein
VSALDAIEERVGERRWTKLSQRITESGMVCVYIGTGYRKLTVRYKLFGSLGSRRLCRFYGYDDDRYVNWGIERASVERLTTNEVPQPWELEFEFTGKNKKAQVLRWLKNN